MASTVVEQEQKQIPIDDVKLLKDVSKDLAKGRKPTHSKSSPKILLSNSLPSESSYMPPDVLYKILANLPAKSLMRSRCVCKYWCSVIDDPYFVSMHRQHSCVYCDKNKKMLVLKRSASKGNRMSTLSILHANTLKKISRILQISDGYEYYIVGNCNGLLLVQRYRPSYSSKELRLWNPCIRKSLILTAIPLGPNLIPGAMYLIGFAPGCKEYKVVVIVFEKCRVEKTTKMQVAVYTLSDQHWTVNNDGSDIDPSYLESLLDGYHRRHRSNAIYFQGKAHWLGNEQYGNRTQPNKSTHLVSFDFDSEKFTISELPFASYKTETDSSTALFVLGESLAIFSISALSSSVRVLKNGEWTLWFSGISNKDGYKLFSSYVLKYSWRNLFYCESDGVGCLICGKYSYNIATCEVQQLTKSKSFDFELDTYSESLVLLKGYGVKDLMSFP